MRLLACLPILLLAPAALAADLTAGPIVGHVTDKSARVWMQFPVAGEVTVNVFDERHTQPLSGVRVGLTGPTPFVCDLPLNGLEPNSTYRIEIKFDGEPVKLPGPGVVLRTAPPPGDEATFSVACGSGLNISPQPPASIAATQIAPVFTPHKLPIFKAIEAAGPRAFFFLGNTGILPPKLDDFPTTHRAAFRYLTDFQTLIRREPDLQPLLRTTPTYAIYNDRDYGPLGADAGYVFMPEAILAFQKFWPNPDWGTPQNPGCFSTTTFGDVDFFLLDSRTFRSDHAMLGTAQLTWLEKNLKASRANFKILTAPCTLWGDNPKSLDPDSWSRFDDEQSRFIQWLADNQINGIIALAGNQSAGQLTRVPPVSATDPQSPNKLHYPLFTLGTSTLAANPQTATGPQPSPRPPALALSPTPAAANPYQLGTPVTADNFATLDFTGAREHRTLTLRLHDAAGKIQLEQVIVASQLKN